MYKLKQLCLLKLSELWLHCSCGSIWGLLAPSGVSFYSFSVCVYCMCLCTRVWNLVYTLQRSTALKQELFWTGTAFQECRVWSAGFRKVLFSVLPLECAIYSHPCSVSFSVFCHSGWMWWALRKNRHFMLFVSSAAVKSVHTKGREDLQTSQGFIFSLF